MIAAVNKAIRANRTARVNKAGKVVRQAQGAVIQETRDNRVDQTVVVVSKVNREECQIVIANKDSKAICPTVIASKASKKKLLQSVMLHLTTKIRTMSSQNRELRTEIRILTAEWMAIRGICVLKLRAGRPRPALFLNNRTR
jgi:hypothetical protein